MSTDKTLVERIHAIVDEDSGKTAAILKAILDGPADGLSDDLHWDFRCSICGGAGNSTEIWINAELADIQNKTNPETGEDV